MTETAPFFADLADGPADMAGHWLRTRDGLRIRIAVSRPEGAGRGTVLMFPGRTEYVEKYGRLARDYTDAGFAFLAVDWRGQGLADKLLPDPRPGHVDRFGDYQHDVAAVMDAAQALNLPRPLHVIAHSMGGAIGLRAAMEGMEVASAVFTGPMWGIRMAPALRPAAWAISTGATKLGMGHMLAPTTRPESYVAIAPFADNLLTTDPEMFDYMRAQITAQPDLQLGGPSLRWLSQALRECRRLSHMPSPDLPCLCFLGTNERIVDTDRIHDRMRRWPKGELVMVPKGEHEVLMEAPAMRRAVIDRTITQFAAAG